MKKLTGADKQAVVDLKEACHLNLANCRLKEEKWAEAIVECDVVIKRADNRKARFRRGDALARLGNHQEALKDLASAVKMDPNNAVVAARPREVEKVLGIEPAEEVDTSCKGNGKGAASSSSVAPMMPPPGMGMPPGGMPGPEQMEAMLDQVTPEQMTQQAEMLKNMSPDQLASMGMPAGMDKAQVEAAASMT